MIASRCAPLDSATALASGASPAGVTASSSRTISPTTPRLVRGGSWRIPSGATTIVPTGSPLACATAPSPTASRFACPHLPDSSGGKAIDADASTISMVGIVARSLVMRRKARSVRARSFQSSRRGSSPWR